MKNKKMILIGVIFVIVLAIIIIFVINIRKDNKKTANNIENISKNYDLLSVSVSKYNQFREEFNNDTKDLLLEDFDGKREKIVNLLSEYSNELKNIDNYITNIKLRCNQVYVDSNVNNICNNYKKTYEKLVNLYISDINKYNEIVTKYNEYKNANIELFKTNYDDYIDYDNDSIYEGRDNSEDN